MTLTLVVGATGYIGRRLLDRAGPLARGTTSKPGAGLLHLNLDEPGAFDYGRLDAGDTVFITAALSSPDVCERERDRAWNVNVTGTAAFIEKAIHRGARIIFFSSDTVYGEQNSPFTEKATSIPAGAYAEMKGSVETLFVTEDNFKSLRLSYVFSREDKFTQYLIDCSSRNIIADVFHPFLRAVVHRDDVISGAISLAERWAEIPDRVINFGGPQIVSRVDYAQALHNVCLPALRFTVTEPDAAFFHNRPRNIAMLSPIFTNLLGRPARSLREAACVEFADVLPLETY